MYYFVTVAVLRVPNKCCLRRVNWILRAFDQTSFGNCIIIAFVELCRVCLTSLLCKDGKISEDARCSNVLVESTREIGRTKVRRDVTKLKTLSLRLSHI